MFRWLFLFWVTAVQADPIFIPKEFKTSDGLTLNGHLALPSGDAGPFPVALLLLGSGPLNRYETLPGEITADGKPARMFWDLEKKLLGRGVAVFLYDKRGIRPKTPDFYEDEIDKPVWATSTASVLADDATNAFEALVSYPQIDPSRVALVGHSEGTILALKIAERHPGARSLHLLGTFTRSLGDIVEYQSVTNVERIFHVVDENNDGYVEAAELQPFLAEEPEFEISMKMDFTGDGRVAWQELRYLSEKGWRRFYSAVYNDAFPWQSLIPQKWFREYFDEGAFLNRLVSVCGKSHLYHGEIDIQTPFEDALELREACGSKLVSFKSYPGLGHGFSPNVGVRGWKNTVGPLDSRVSDDVAEGVAKSF